jgi:putative transposase
MLDENIVLPSQITEVETIDENKLLRVEMHNVTEVNNLKEFFMPCDHLCFMSKNLYNQGLYRVRQQFFKDGTHMGYQELNKEMFGENQVDYIALPSNSSQQTLMMIEQNCQSFFALLKTPNLKAKAKMPKYLKKDGRYECKFTYQQCRIKTNKKDGLDYVYFNKKSGLKPLRTKVKENGGKLKEVRIIPITGGYKIEIVYEKIEKKEKIKKDDCPYYMGIDPGVNILGAITTNKKDFDPFLIEGSPLKSINHHYNKEIAKAKSELPKMNTKDPASYYINRKTKEKVLRQNYSSKKIEKLYLDRDNEINNYLHHASKLIVETAMKEKISFIVIGYNEGWKTECNLGKVNNQNFMYIPFRRFFDMIEYKANEFGIEVIYIGEAHTSKCSALDKEPVCHQDKYIGKRIHRGQFKYSKGYINADINGSYNILRKVIGDDFLDGILTNIGSRLRAIRKVDPRKRTKFGKLI